MTRLHHVVLFQLHPGTDVDDVLARLTALGEQPGVVSWRVERSLDERKGVVVLEDAVFASAEALEAFRVSDAHRAVTGHLSTCADWLVADHLLEDGQPQDGQPQDGQPQEGQPQDGRPLTAGG